MANISIQQLKDLLLGKRISVISIYNNHAIDEGVCSGVHFINEYLGYYSLELQNGPSYGIMPTAISSNSVVGFVKPGVQVGRKIKLVDVEEETDIPG
jgi:hypothetical protein